MLPPSLILSLLLASIYAFAFYLLFGRRERSLAYYWLVSLVAFFGSQRLPLLEALDRFAIGDVQPVTGAIICLAALFVANLVRL
ncbi:MAG: hypothetical protein HY871_06305 [Chloroflexi bacterium]|nr:hypothetical protein [Chloroflexota bacterium]